MILTSKPVFHPAVRCEDKLENTPFPPSFADFVLAITMDRLNPLLAAAQGLARKEQGAANQDSLNLIDNSETVYISSLALLKMLRHGRAGVPMEVMGLMLGEFVDDFTVRVVDVFAMPQSGTSVSVEAVDPVFQTKMMDMLRQTGRCVHSVDYICAMNANGLRDPKQSLAGTIPTQDSAAGSPPSTSTLNKLSSNSLHVPSQWW